MPIPKTRPATCAADMPAAEGAPGATSICIFCERFEKLLFRVSTKAYEPALACFNPVPLVPPIWKCALAKFSLPQLRGSLSSSMFPLLLSVK
jgi:hypothetical protein